MNRKKELGTQDVVENTIVTANTSINSWKISLHVFELLVPIFSTFFLWRRRDLLERLLVEFDKNCVSSLCPSWSKREHLLKWVQERLVPHWIPCPLNVSLKLVDVWEDGSLLCTLINSALPGACPNPHRHHNQSPHHGQALAFKYFGVAPLFSTEDFNQQLCGHLEFTFFLYLSQIQASISQSNVDDLYEWKFTSTYIARGMGLFDGEQYRKSIFYLYSNFPKLNNRVLISIKGPYHAYGSISIPSFDFYNSHPKQINRKRILYSIKEEQQKGETVKSNSKKHLFRTVISAMLPFLKTDNSNTVLTKIPIEINKEIGRIKVTYTPQHSGIHIICIITDGCHLQGSPFYLSVTERNMVDGYMEKSYATINHKQRTNSRMSSATTNMNKGKRSKPDPTLDLYFSTPISERSAKLTYEKFCKKFELFRSNFDKHESPGKDLPENQMVFSKNEMEFLRNNSKASDKFVNSIYKVIRNVKKEDNYRKIKNSNNNTLIVTKEIDYDGKSRMQKVLQKDMNFEITNQIIEEHKKLQKIINNKDEDENTSSEDFIVYPEPENNFSSSKVKEIITAFENSDETANDSIQTANFPGLPKQIKKTYQEIMEDVINIPKSELMEMELPQKSKYLPIEYKNSTFIDTEMKGMNENDTIELNKTEEGTKSSSIEDVEVNNEALNTPFPRKMFLSQNETAPKQIEKTKLVEKDTAEEINTSGRNIMDSVCNIAFEQRNFLPADVEDLAKSGEIKISLSKSGGINIMENNSFSTITVVEFEEVDDNKARLEKTSTPEFNNTTFYFSRHNQKLNKDSVNEHSNCTESKNENLENFKGIGVWENRCHPKPQYKEAKTNFVRAKIISYNNKSNNYDPKKATNTNIFDSNNQRYGNEFLLMANDYSNNISAHELYPKGESTNKISTYDFITSGMKQKGKNVEKKKFNFMSVDPTYSSSNKPVKCLPVSKPAKDLSDRSFSNETVIDGNKTCAESSGKDIIGRKIRQLTDKSKAPFNYLNRVDAKMILPESSTSKLEETVNDLIINEILREKIPPTNTETQIKNYNEDKVVDKLSFKNASENSISTVDSLFKIQDIRDEEPQSHYYENLRHNSRRKPREDGNLWKDNFCNSNSISTQPIALFEKEFQNRTPSPITVAEDQDRIFEIISNTIENILEDLQNTITKNIIYKALETPFPSQFCETPTADNYNTYLNEIRENFVNLILDNDKTLEDMKYDLEVILNKIKLLLDDLLVKEMILNSVNYREEIASKKQENLEESSKENLKSDIEIITFKVRKILDQLSDLSLPVCEKTDTFNSTSVSNLPKNTIQSYYLKEEENVILSQSSLNRNFHRNTDNKDLRAGLDMALKKIDLLLEDLPPENNLKVKEGIRDEITFISNNKKTNLMENDSQNSEQLKKDIDFMMAKIDTMLKDLPNKNEEIIHGEDLAENSKHHFHNISYPLEAEDKYQTQVNLDHSNLKIFRRPNEKVPLSASKNSDKFLRSKSMCYGETFSEDTAPGKMLVDDTILSSNPTNRSTYCIVLEKEEKRIRRNYFSHSLPGLCLLSPEQVPKRRYLRNVDEKSMKTKATKFSALINKSQEDCYETFPDISGFLEENNRICHVDYPKDFSVPRRLSRSEPLQSILAQNKMYVTSQIHKSHPNIYFCENPERKTHKTRRKLKSFDANMLTVSSTTSNRVTTEFKDYIGDPTGHNERKLQIRKIKSSENQLAKRTSRKTTSNCQINQEDLYGETQSKGQLPLRTLPDCYPSVKDLRSKFENRKELFSGENYVSRTKRNKIHEIETEKSSCLENSKEEKNLGRGIVNHNCNGQLDNKGTSKFTLNSEKSKQRHKIKPHVLKTAPETTLHKTIRVQSNAPRTKENTTPPPHYIIPSPEVLNTTTHGVTKNNERETLAEDRVVFFTESPHDGLDATSEDTEEVKDIMKNQFVRARDFFKMLETSKDQHQNISQSSKKNILNRRRLSLNNDIKEKKNVFGGSFPLTRVSEKFALENIYKDVLGNRSGSFKGAPNRVAVADTLASVPIRNILFDIYGTENLSPLDIFQQKIKKKSRKSLKSIFDINY